MRLVLTTFMLVCLVGCGPKLPPNVSVEAKVAIRGTQLISALRATVPEIKKFVCQPDVPQPCLAAQDAVRVFGALETAGKTGEQLALVLTAVDNAKTAAERTSGMEKARALLTSISTSMQTALIIPIDPTTRGELLKIFGTATQLLLAISTF